MSQIIKPRNPVINWGNPLTKGLVFDMPFFERGGTKALDVSQSKTIGTLTNGPVQVNDIFGPVMNFSGATNKLVAVTTNPAQDNLSKFSLETYFYAISLGGGGFGALFYKGDGNDGTNRFRTNLENTFTNNRLRFVARFTGGAAGWNSNWTCTFNVWTHAIITFDGSSAGTNPTMYINGVDLGLANIGTSSGTFASDSSSITVGNRTTADTNWDGLIAYSRLWNRILSPQEAKSLYTNPFQIYQQPLFPYANLLAAGAAFIGYRTLLGIGRG